MPPETQKIRLRCPTCDSDQVVYSCEPTCCFRHICADCMTTFETASVELGGQQPDCAPPKNEERGSDEPVVPCVACDSIAVYTTENSQLVCTDCGQLLALDLAEITART